MTNYARKDEKSQAWTVWPDAVPDRCEVRVEKDCWGRRDPHQCGGRYLTPGTKRCPVHTLNHKSRKQQRIRCPHLGPWRIKRKIDHDSVIRQLVCLECGDILFSRFWDAVYVKKPN